MIHLSDLHLKKPGGESISCCGVVEVGAMGSLAFISTSLNVRPLRYAIMGGFGKMLRVFSDCWSVSKCLLMICGAAAVAWVYVVG